MFIYIHHHVPNLAQNHVPPIKFSSKGCATETECTDNVTGTVFDGVYTENDVAISINPAGMVFIDVAINDHISYSCIFKQNTHVYFYI